MASREPIVILGAGLAGMAAAIRLKKGFRLLERRDVPGGLCDTVNEGGFRFDRTGHLLHLSNGRRRKLVLDLLGDDLVEIQRRSRIFSHGIYTHYPYQANLHGLPPKVAAECLKGFIEAAVARRGKRARGKTFEEFILANFGKGIAGHFMIPYNQKLWGVHPREIIDAWCDRFVPTPELDEVIDGTVGLAHDEMGYNATFLYPRQGIGALSDAMAEKAGEIEYGTSPSAVDFRRKRIRVKGRWIGYRALISSLPLDRLVPLLVDPPSRLVGYCSGLRCTSLRYLDVALNRRPGTEYHWSYVPQKRYPFYRVGSYSSFSSRMAPRARGNLYVELANRRPVNLNVVMPRVISGLMEMRIIDHASDIAFVRPRFIRRAYVVYDRWHSRATGKILEWLESENILSVGRYGKWEYAAMENAIVQGFEAAKIARKT